ncbi:hypothetical protein HN51_045465 [Arachis hypogaea]
MDLYNAKEARKHRHLILAEKRRRLSEDGQKENLCLQNWPNTTTKGSLHTLQEKLTSLKRKPLTPNFTGMF